MSIVWQNVYLTMGNKIVNLDRVGAKEMVGKHRVAGFGASFIARLRLQ